MSWLDFPSQFWILFVHFDEFHRGELHEHVLRKKVSEKDGRKKVTEVSECMQSHRPKKKCLV